MGWLLDIKAVVARHCRRLGTCRLCAQLIYIAAYVIYASVGLLDCNVYTDEYKNG
jgi:hypothetical protein